MAYEGNLVIVPGLEAGSDLSSNQFHFGSVAADGQIDVTGAGLAAQGVIQDAPAVAGLDVSLACLGVTKMRAGATVTAGDKIMSDATGRGITGTATNFANGIALSGAAVGELFTMLIEKRDILA